MKARSLRTLAISTGAVVALTGLTAASAGAAVSGTTAKTVTAAPASSVGSLTSVVKGTFTNSAGKGTFSGTFTPKRFSVKNGVLEATGVLKGTLTDASGKSLGTVNQTVTDSVNTSAAANAPVGCQVLNLVLGPLNLNLLGLVVTLNQVTLNITAVPGAGNLLGNLLCAVANLLNPGGGLTSLSTLLNEILAALGL
ncbi:MAG: hypothetical protein JO016_01665 [Actinobacteria bacterium]|nr:hypothetical protein [Actinomycetota bacterium]